MGQWVGLGHITKYQIKLELIKIIRFMICGDTSTYGWMGALMGGLMSNHSNQINLELIEKFNYGHEHLNI